MPDNVLVFRSRGADSWNNLAALAWHGYQIVGRGVVVMDIQPAGDSILYYTKTDSPKLNDLWDGDREDLDGMIERYEPLEEFVLLVAYSGIGDEARRVMPNPEASLYLKPPVAFETVGVSA